MTDRRHAYRYAYARFGAGFFSYGYYCYYRFFTGPSPAAP